MKISQVLPETGSEVRCDGYIPVVALTLGATDFPLVHWRTGDAKSLLDFGIDQVTGVICKVTVTMLNGLQVDPAHEGDIRELSRGVPSVVVENWDPKAPLHVDRPVNAALLGNRLVLQFGSQKAQLTSAIRNGRVVFQVDQSRTIYGIEFLDLSAKELEEFRYAVGVIT